MSEPSAAVEPRSNARGSTEFVQPIAIFKHGSHWSTIRAAAAASALAYVRDSTAPEWSDWLAGPFAKSVRRTDARGIERVSAEVDSSVVVRLGDAVAVATRPYTYETLPRLITKMQVSGTDLPREVNTRSQEHSPSFRVYLNDSLAMSTGKSAAQAAHAVFLYVRDQLTADGKGMWAADPTSFDVEAIPAAEMALLARTAPVRIHDAGHTEVSPGSLTALALHV